MRRNHWFSKESVKKGWADRSADVECILFWVQNSGGISPWPALPNQMYALLGWPRYLSPQHILQRKWIWKLQKFESGKTARAVWYSSDIHCNVRVVSYENIPTRLHQVKITRVLVLGPDIDNSERPPRCTIGCGENLWSRAASHTS